MPASPDPRSRFGREDAPAAPVPWRRWIVIAFWVVAALAAGAFPLVRAHRMADAVASEMDRRIALLEVEVAQAQAARRDHAALLADVAAARAALDADAEHVPCEMGLSELIPELRRRLEPLGVTLRPDLGFKHHRDAYTEANIPLLLPQRDGADAEARAALAGMRRLLLWQPWSGDPRGRCVVALSWSCEGAPRTLSAHDAPIRDLDRVFWPFSLRLRPRRDAIARLRQARDADAAPLLDKLRLDWLNEDRRRLHDVVVELEQRPDAIVPGSAPRLP